MTDFTSLQSKVNDLKAKVAQYSITPAYLGALLDDFITLMKKIDMTGMSDDVQTALRNANSALEKSQSALTKAVNAENSANLATQSALNAIQKASDALSKAENAVTVANTAKNTADAAKSMAANAQGNANTANNTADEALSRIEAVEDKIGTPNGIATLDEHGLIPSNQLPSYIDDVVEFDGMLPILGDIKIESASASSGSIYYVPSLDTFVCMSRNDGGIVGSGAKYYANWGGADAFGEFTMNGRKPASSKIFIDVSTNNQYRYSGSTLVSTGSPLSLGETEHTAYSGDKGKQLRVDVNELQSKFGGLMIFPFNGTYIRVSDTGNHMPPTQGVWWTPSSEGGCFLFCSSQFGYSVLDYNLDGLGLSIGKESCLNQTGRHRALTCYTKVRFRHKLPAHGVRFSDGLLLDELCQPSAVLRRIAPVIPGGISFFISHLLFYRGEEGWESVGSAGRDRFGGNTPFGGLIASGLWKDFVNAFRFTMGKGKKAGLSERKRAREAVELLMKAVRYGGAFIALMNFANIYNTPDDPWVWRANLVVISLIPALCPLLRVLQVFLAPL